MRQRREAERAKNQCVIPPVLLALQEVGLSDNLSSHKVPQVRELIAKAGAEVLYLPPYSPDLNPIEKAWAKLKEHLRSAQARSQQALDQALADALNGITAENAKAWFRTCSAGTQ